MKLRIPVQTYVYNLRKMNILSKMKNLRKMINLSKIRIKVWKFLQKIRRAFRLDLNSFSKILIL